LVRAIQEEVIGKYINDHKFTYTIWDPAAVAIMNEVRSVCKLRMEQADNSVDIGIQRITKLLKENRLKVFETCEDFIREMEGYCYEKNGSSKPGHDCSHSPDSLRYGFSRSLAGVYDLVRVGGIARKKAYSGYDPLDLHRRRVNLKKERQIDEAMPYESFTSLDSEES